MRILDWPENERPRERLQVAGAHALSEAELVAILLGTGARGVSAVDLGRALIGALGGIGGLLQADHPGWRRVRGIGPAKRAKLHAALELARRALGAELAHGAALSSPATVRDYLRLQLRGIGHEVFVVIYLDAKHNVIATEEMFRGTLDQTSVYPREIVKAALARNAAAVILAHNHPSGVAEPSAADQRLTRVVKDALRLVDILVLDHFIVAGAATLSFAERGLL